MRVDLRIFFSLGADKNLLNTWILFYTKECFGSCSFQNNYISSDWHFSMTTCITDFLVSVIHCQIKEERIYLNLINSEERTEWQCRHDNRWAEKEAVTSSSLSPNHRQWTGSDTRLKLLKTTPKSHPFF